MKKAPLTAQSLAVSLMGGVVIGSDVAGTVGAIIGGLVAVLLVVKASA